MTTQSGIDSVLKEARVFNPPAEFQARANVASIADYERLYREADADPETFWGKIAEDLHWFTKWDKVLEWQAPFAKWFVGGPDEHLLQLSRPSRGKLAPQQSGIYLGGRAGRCSNAHLPAAAHRGLQVRQCSQVAGRSER